MTAQPDCNKLQPGGDGQSGHTGVVAPMRARRLLAVADAARYLGVSVATVERLVFRGALPVVKIGGATRYDLDDLDTYIECNRRRNRRRMA